MRTQTWQHAGRYVSALVSEIPKWNGWAIAQQAGYRTPDRTQRLLNRAAWTGRQVKVRRRGTLSGWSAAGAEFGHADCKTRTLKPIEYVVDASRWVPPRVGDLLDSRVDDAAVKTDLVANELVG